MMLYARVFSPEEFGVVALINIWLAFSLLFGEAGITSAIIAGNDLSKRDKGSIFNFTIILSIIIVFVSYLSYLAYTHFHGGTEYLIYLPFAFLALIFTVTNSVPLGIIFSDKKFFLVTINTIVSEVIVLSVIGLLHDKVDKKILLCFRLTFVSFFSFFLNYLYCLKHEKLSFRIGIDIESLNKIKSFSSYLFGFNILNYFSRNIDNLVVSKYLGISSLAIYDKSYTVMKYPLQLLSRAVTPALLPVLKDYKEDKELILKTHIKLIKTALLFGGIISFLISTNSELIVYLLLGNQWSEVVPVISILAISIPMQLTTSFNGAFWQTFGNTKSQFKISIFTSLFTILVVTIAALIEPTLSFITLAVTCSLNITCLNALLRLFKTLYGQDYKKTILIVFSSTIPFVVSFFVYFMYTFSFANEQFISLMVSILLAVSVYSFGLKNIIKNGIL